MRATFLRILKTGLPTAGLLAGLGYLYAVIAGIYLDANVPPRPTGRPGTDGEQVTRALEIRLPVLMAGGGFALIAAGELLLSLWRPPAAGPAAPPNAIPASGLDPEVEKLLNQLLEQADAADARRSVPPNQIDQEPAAEEVAVAGQRGFIRPADLDRRRDPVAEADRPGQERTPLRHAAEVD